MEETVQKTWKPIAAGVLDIVNGVSEFIWAGVGITLLLLTRAGASLAIDRIPEVTFEVIPDFLFPLLIIVPILWFAGGLLSLIAGIYAVQGKKWKLALAGSIAAIFGTLILGVLATVFTVMAKDEFES